MPSPDRREYECFLKPGVLTTDFVFFFLLVGALSVWTITLRRPGQSMIIVVCLPFADLVDGTFTQTTATAAKNFPQLSYMFLEGTSQLFELDATYILFHIGFGVLYFPILKE